MSTCPVGCAASREAQARADALIDEVTRLRAVIRDYERVREYHCRLCEAAHAPLDPTKETT